MTGRREKRVTGDLPGESYDRLYSRPRSRLGISHVNTCLVMIEEREWFTRLVLRDRVAPYRTDYNFVKWFVASAWKNRGWLERKRIDNGNPWAWEFRLPGARAVQDPAHMVRLPVDGAWQARKSRGACGRG